MTSIDAIYSISKAASTIEDLSEFASTVGDFLAASGSSEVQLTLVNTATGNVAQFSRRESDQPMNGLVIARDLVVRGSRYGRMELKFVESSPTHLLFADIVASQLARFAELQSEQTQQEQIANFLQKSASELAARKLLARASGLFTTRKAPFPGRRAAA